MPIKKWADVFKVMSEARRKIRKENPDMSITEATKAAWKDERVLAARKEYDKIKAAKEAKDAKEGGAPRKRVVRKRRSVSRKRTVRRSTAKKSTRKARKSPSRKAKPKRRVVRRSKSVKRR